MGINERCQSVFTHVCATRSAGASERSMNELESRVFVVNGKRLLRKSLADLLATNGYSVEIFAGVAQFLARAPHPGPGAFWSH